MIRHPSTIRPTLLSRGSLSTLALLATGAMAMTVLPAAGQDRRANPNTYTYTQIDDADILTRGPVHEAFAEPVVFDPEAGMVVPAAPPEAIDELPPAERPDGPYVTWIPGYWSWDEDYNEFIWISGIWRDIPPGREWIAGYWARTPRGYQWISGYWDTVGSVETQYLPEPPQFVDSESVTLASPSPNQVRIPGCWLWRGNRYVWRPGYWLEGRRDWVWVPASYTWTPRGYIFVDGYWDHDVSHRGVLFAPVRMRSRYYTQSHFRYSPRTVIDPDVFTDHLFIRSDRGRYYFGDYYEPRYANAGYRPWFSVRDSRKCYDPIYVHRRWEHRNDRDWDSNLRREYDHRRSDQRYRPRRTLADERRYIGEHRNDHGGGGVVHQIAKTILQLSNRKHGSMRFQRIDEGERERLSRRREDVHRMRDHRQQVETRARGDDRPDHRYYTRTKPATVKRERSPFSWGHGKDVKSDKRPPESHQPPKVDEKVQPRKRAHDIRKHEGTKDDKRPDARKRDERRRDDRNRNDDSRDDDHKKKKHND